MLLMDKGRFEKCPGFGSEDFSHPGGVKRASRQQRPQLVAEMVDFRIAQRLSEHDVGPARLWTDKQVVHRRDHLAELSPDRSPVSPALLQIAGQTPVKPEPRRAID